MLIEAGFVKNPADTCTSGTNPLLAGSKS
jgi:hypothetical protein